jgi:ATP-dependent exoDNAse (exonuclease V) alpha subunit
LACGSCTRGFASAEETEVAVCLLPGTELVFEQNVRHHGRWFGRSITYGFGELDMLVPAYAATFHKSQGSEYPAVIIPVLTQHYAMLQRNLLYTGVTRGKKLVVLVGQKKAVTIAVRNVSGRRRWSKLSEWLRPKPPVSRQFGMAS